MADKSQLVASFFPLLDSAAQDPTAFVGELFGVDGMSMRIGDRAIVSLATDDAPAGALQLRAEMLDKLRAGEALDAPLVVEATTFIQRATPNRNFSRFKRGTLRSTASTFGGMPVLVNHAHRDVNARIGTIMQSRAVRADNGSGDVSFRQTLSIVKPWAQLGFLDGTLDRFSIGWHGGKVTCSVHNQPLWGADCCPCWPGETVNGKVVEAVWEGATGIEVSAVNVPAVVGTGVEQIRAALSALGVVKQSGVKPTRSNAMDEIKKQLGLPETATEAEVLAAIAANNAKLAAALEESKRVAQEAAASAFATQLEAALADGRLTVTRDAQGNRVESELEQRLKALHAIDAKAATAMLDALPKRHPNGGGLQSKLPSGGVDKSPALAAFPGADNPHLESCMAQMGVTLEEVQRFGPHHRTNMARGVVVPPHLTSVLRTRDIDNNPHKASFR